MAAARIESPMSPESAPKQERSTETRRRLLDAAVDELLEGGFTRFSTHGVARRAGISRGAQQHHFSHKNDLVTAAVQHLAERSMRELEEATRKAGRISTRRVLDALFTQYTGPLFATMLELSLATRTDDDLRDAVRNEETAVNRMINDWAHSKLAGHANPPDEFDELFAMAMSTVRGIAILQLFGHSHASVQRQWQFARDRLVSMLCA
ncbi:TetR family transcriptional regulator [Tamaricihabitans halophyticus]|uniref:TetR family transcriptional regulator n=2 Tax=Tamaricihabitans halophyticus TaxID=1262583 RepID=A0A4R2Q264_9PSEU|nr:TetR family transcriptional regulator [Tamaricihabitans halophyticus]